MNQKDALPPRYTRNFAEPDDDLEPGEYTLDGQTPQEPTPMALAEARDMQRIIDELSGDVQEHTIQVYRARGSRVSGAPLFSRSPGEFSKDEVVAHIKYEYGAGEYIIQLRKRGQVVRQELFPVELSLSEEQAYKDRKAGRIQPAHGVPATQGQGGDIASLLLAMQEQQRADREAQRERDFQSQKQFLEMQNKNNEMLIKVLTSEKGKEKDDSFDRFITVIQTKFMQDMMGEKKSPLSQVKELLEVSSLIGGGGGGEESVLQTALKTIGPSIGKVAEAVALQAKLQAGSTPAPLPVKPNPVVKDAPAQLPPPPPPGEEDFKVLIRMIERGAAQDKDPVTYAELILDQIGPDMAKQLFSDPKAVEAVMGQINPEILAARQEWFGELMEVVLELLSPETDDGEAPPVENDESAPAVPDTGTDTGTQPTD